jgi:hypothetical protein
MGMGSWLLGISPPTDDASLRVFIDVLGRAGARLNRDVLIEPFCDGEWCLLVIRRRRLGIWRLMQLGDAYWELYSACY